MNFNQLWTNCNKSNVDSHQTQILELVTNSPNLLQLPVLLIDNQLQSSVGPGSEPVITIELETPEEIPEDDTLDLNIQLQNKSEDTLSSELFHKEHFQTTDDGISSDKNIIDDYYEIEPNLLIHFEKITKFRKLASHLFVTPDYIHGLKYVEPKSTKWLEYSCFKPLSIFQCKMNFNQFSFQHVTGKTDFGLLQIWIYYVNFGHGLELKLLLRWNLW